MKKNEKNPLISVVMPVFNAADYLRETIESVLNQTYSNFEFLIFNDGSKDNSLVIIKSYDDPRIILYDYQVNSGYVNHLNAGFALACGKYIARMDADDIALPRRFEVQVALLEERVEIGLCSCRTETIGPNYLMVEQPVTHNEIRHCFLLANPIAHPGVMLRTSLVRQHGLAYRHEFMPAEDYYLWCSLVDLTQLHIIPQVLLRYRVHEAQISAQRSQLQNHNAATIKVEYLKMVGVRLSADEEVKFRVLVSGPSVHSLSPIELQDIATVAESVVAALATHGFSAAEVRRIMGLHWFRLLKNAGRFRLGMVPLFLFNSEINFAARMRLLGKCVLGWRPRQTKMAKLSD